VLTIGCVAELVHRQTVPLHGHQAAHSRSLIISVSRLLQTGNVTHTYSLPGGLVQLCQKALALHMRINWGSSIDLSKVTTRLHTKDARRRWMRHQSHV
jgi:hypothetical protein